MKQEISVVIHTGDNPQEEVALLEELKTMMRGRGWTWVCHRPVTNHIFGKGNAVTALFTREKK